MQDFNIFDARNLGTPETQCLTMLNPRVDGRGN